MSSAKCEKRTDHIFSDCVVVVAAAFWQQLDCLKHSSCVKRSASVEQAYEAFAPALRIPPRASSLPPQIRNDVGKSGVDGSDLITDNT